MEWIITSNQKYYDVEGAFNSLVKLNWKQSVNIAEGDVVYIYVGKPTSAIKFKCIARKVNLDKVSIDDSEYIIDGAVYQDYGRYMELELLEKYDAKELAYDALIVHGLKSVQGPSKVSSELSNYIKRVTLEKKGNINDIEDKEAIRLLSGGYENFLELQIREYDRLINSNKNKEEELEDLRSKFVSDFKIQKVIKMEKEDYVVGLKKQDTFCYRLETELIELGNIHGSTSFKFGLYYGTSGDDKEPKYRTAKGKFGEDPDQALEKIKEQIVNLLAAGSSQDYQSIRECILAPIFKGKILSTYYPETYLSIFSGEHLSYFLEKLAISYSDADDELDKQLKLLEWKKKNYIAKNWSMYSFARFLYHTFGSLTEAKKQLEILQEDYDKNYPKDYVKKVGITINQWKELLEDKEVFLHKDIDLMKRIYTSKNHAKTCYELGIEDGVSSSAYIKPVVELGKRISNRLSLKPVLNSGGKESWWSIPFWGRYRENGHFEWKLRPKLAKAMQSLYPELDYIIDDDVADNELVEDLRKFPKLEGDPQKAKEYKPKKKQEPILSNGRLSYPRDRQTALNALAYANYECEINKDHPTFYRRNSDKKYTEPHHLVPMSYSEKFNVSLDVEANIVSLCSNCHNHLHYGEGIEELVIKLFRERKDRLAKVEIFISIEELKKIYNIN